MYAIVDIETTGSYAAGSGITEIAIIIHDGNDILHTWQSLINPQRPIPRFIQQLTGITEDMVASAPSFAELAEHIHALLHDKIFVAHNVNFDFSFVKYHLEQYGYSLDVRKLCTIRLARKIQPGYPKYGLGSICHQLGIPHSDHHRAFGDAKATALLFSHLLEHDTKGHLATMLKGKNKEQYLPPNLPVDQVDVLPECPGVYYFYNAAGKVIYVGKAINLQKRVKSHFSNNKAGRQKQDFLRDIFRISYQAVGTDLMAHILESVEIRRLWPIHNRSQRGYHPKYAVYTYEDQQGYIHLALDAHKPNIHAIYTSNAFQDGASWLRRLISEFGLCARLCNLAKGADCWNGKYAEGCDGECCKSPESYNARVQEAVQWVRKALPTMVLIDQGRTVEEQSCILIEEGIYKGMGYFSRDQELQDLKSFRKCIEPYPDNDYIRNLVYRHASDYPSKCIRWEQGIAVVEEPV